MTAQSVRADVIDQLDNNDFYLEDVRNEDEYVRDNYDGTQTVVTLEAGKPVVLVASYNNKQMMVSSESFKIPAQMNQFLAKIA